MSEKEKNESSCDHDCDHCAAACNERVNPEDFRIHPNADSTIRHAVGIVSGKGGVGKSFVTSLLAAELQRRGKRVGVLDGDITGPSMAKVFGIKEPAMQDGTQILPAVTKSGIQVVSMNMFLEKEDAAGIWRAPMITGYLQMFYKDVHWDNVDELLIDMPPGTGDVPLTVFQSIKLDGIIVVTSPQELVSMIVGKAINMARMMNIPILGLIENMSYVECDQCHHRMYVFGPSHLDEIAEKFKVPVLARIPLDPRIAAASDAGQIEDLSLPEIAPAADCLEKL